MKREAWFAGVLGIGSLIAIGATTPLSSRKDGVPVAARSQAFQNVPPTVAAKMKAFNKRVDEAAKALKEGDVGLAERLYQELAQEKPTSQAVTLTLARLYDSQKRDQEALELYRRLMDGQSNVTRISDPIVMVRFADLSLKFGSAREAESAYRMSWQIVQREIAPTLPSFDPMAQDMTSIRSSAYTAVACKQRLYGEYKQEKMLLTRACALTPKWWVAHFYRGRSCWTIGPLEEAKSEFLLATELAPAKEKPVVKAMRQKLGFR
jgi:Flp pilus assembly protein TadD